MEKTKVFLNTWYHYNNGFIGFEWMTPDEAREFMESKEGITEFEEWFIADIDNYTGVEFRDLNYMNVNTVLDTIDTLESMADWEREAVVAIMEAENCDVQTAIDRQDNYQVYEDRESYYNSCDELVDDSLVNCSEWLTRYFDYEAYHRDCMMDAYEASNGVVLVG